MKLLLNSQMAKRHSLHLQTERFHRKGGSALVRKPATVTKRLGDGFYEQRLIREQIAQLTGRRFLTGYTNDEEAYQALMINGVTFAQQYQFIPGVALSEAQIAQLTSDIVWLVERTITLADGTTVQALVPQVYVRLQPGDINGQGTLLAGDSINLKLSGDPATGAGGTLTNSGSIAGRTVVSITADNIHNLGGRISANNTQLNARNDINNLGGSIQGNDLLILQAGHDINIASTTQSSQNQTGLSSFSRTNLDRVAGLYVDNPNGILVASSGNNINLQGAMISNSGGSNSGTNGITVLDAGNNLNLTTITTAEQNNIIKNSKNYIKHGNTQEIGTVIQTEGDLILNAGNNVTARAANVTSEQGNLTVNAANDIHIESGIATSNSAQAQSKKKSGTFSSKKTERRDTFNDTEVISSTFSGNTVDLNAQNNITVTGSNVVGTNNVNLNAQNNITIESAQATHDETHYYKEKKSGFSTSSSSIGYGTSNLKTTNDTQQVNNVGSTVGSVQGNVNINSGNQYTQTASDVLTPQGDINITAQNVDINAATDTYTNQQTMKYKQSGITLSISNPVISAIQTAQQMSKAADNTSDPRLQALAAGTAALAANNAKDAIVAGNTPQLDENGLQILDANGNNTAENPANQVGGINLSLSIGTSKASSTSSQTSSTAKSSTLNAGGNINITATGAGQDSDINVTGSQIKAVNDVTLKADDQINLLAAQNVDTLNAKNKGSSASLGVSFGSDGFLVTAGASGSKGKTNGNGSTWTETQIQGGNNTGDTITLQSGTDTNLIGAQVSGNQVIANVGTTGTGNLNIESLQDTNQYKDKQQSIGGTVSIGYGKMGGSFNYSDSKTKSNYQSVNEQAGIFAGDEGFQVNVNGNTDLKGAVIASTDKAIQDNKNSLTTETLTTSNIQNSAEYESSSTSFGGGYSVSGNNVGFRSPDTAGSTPTNTGMVGTNQQGQATTGGLQTPGTTLPSLKGFSATLPVAMSAGDKADSTTVSGVSHGNINVTNSTAQTALTGKDAATTVATLNQDVKVAQSTDAEGNTTAIAVDSQGNNLANTLTPIFTEEKKAEINAGFAITQAFTQLVGTFLNNRAKEADQKTQAAKDVDATARDPNNGLSDEQRQLMRDQAITLRNEADQINNDWGAGGTYRQIATALIAAASGNITATNAQFVNNMVVNYVQQQGASYIGNLVADGTLTEGSPLHAALHAIVACGGAAASGQDCGAGATGAATSSLLTGLFSDTNPNETNAEREAKRNIIISLVTGIGAITNTNTATATNAATVAVDNNWLATQQTVQLNKEIAQAANVLEEIKIRGKWAAVGIKQDALTATGVGKGLAESGWSDIKGLGEFLSDPIAGLDGLKTLISSDEARAAMGGALCLT